jgi:hypothetical protein
MIRLAADQFVTPVPWHPSLQHPQYGPGDTYALAARWVQACPTVADWGGGFGVLQTYLPATTQYTVVEGTRHGPRAHVLADLATYHAPSDGIVLRHVLDNTPRWADVLANALAAFRQRLVIVTFTPAALETRIAHLKSGWPIWHFHPGDLRRAMGRCLVADVSVPTSHPEHVYYLERR